MIGDTLSIQGIPGKQDATDCVMITAQNQDLLKAVREYQHRSSGILSLAHLKYPIWDIHLLPIGGMYTVKLPPFRYTLTST